ncbi:hypothetical protein [Microcoleus sp. S28C3]
MSLALAESAAIANASLQLPSDGRSPAVRSAFVAGEERASRSQK